MPVDEDAFNKKIITGQVCLAVSGGLLLIMLAVVIDRAIRKKRRPQLSLSLLADDLLFCCLAVCHRERSERQGYKGLPGSVKFSIRRVPCYNRAMRLSPFIFIALAGSLAAGEPMPAFPLWNGSESVADYAKRVNLPPTQTLDLGSGVKLELVLIPAGKFVMGTPEHEKPAVGQTMVGVSGGILIVAVIVLLVLARKKRKRPQFSMAFMLLLTFVAAVGVWGSVRWNEALKHPNYYPNEHPAHAVTLTKPFYMGKYDVTQEQYQQVIGSNPSNFIGKDNPVETVSWDEAQAFCKKVAEQSKQTVRLPTEMEWEYACRGGTNTLYYSGDTDKDLDRVAWYSGNIKNTTHPVGQKEPNAFGLYDMHGNVWQWCQDWYGEDYYSTSPAEEPQGPVTGACRVLRGGSWNNDPVGCPAARYWLGPANRGDYIGFRVVVVPAFRTP